MIASRSPSTLGSDSLLGNGNFISRGELACPSGEESLESGGKGERASGDRLRGAGTLEAGGLLGRGEGDADDDTRSTNSVCLAVLGVSSSSLRRLTTSLWRG